MEFEIARAKKKYSPVSGDSFAFTKIGGRSVFLLCDGMGSGFRARALSGFAKSFILRLLKKGLSPQAALAETNRRIFTKTNGQAFSTADLLIISGQKAYIFKAGAAPTAVLRKGKPESVFIPTLPLGLFCEADAAFFELSLLRGDRIVLMSDGAIPDGSFSLSEGTAPQMVESAKRLYGRCDDVTVALIRL